MCLYSNVLNKILWGRQLHQGEKSLQPSRQQYLEDGDGASPSNFGELPHLRGCLTEKILLNSVAAKA